MLVRFKKHDVPVRFNELRDSFFQPFESMFNDFFNDSVFPTFSRDFGKVVESSNYPKVNIKNFDDRFELEAHVPGHSKESVKIKVEDGMLSIIGEKRQEDSQEEKGDYIYHELKKSSFCRSWTLGDNIDRNKITAKFKDGILYLSIPKVKSDKTIEEEKYIAIE